jgi:hypothetical protein
MDGTSEKLPRRDDKRHSSNLRAEEDSEMTNADMSRLLAEIIREGAEYDHETSREIVRAVRLRGETGLLIEMQSGDAFEIAITQVAIAQPDESTP